MRQYVETDLEADREVANTLAELIIGGTFSSDLAAGAGPDGEDQGDEARPHERFVYRSVYKPQAKGRLSVRETASGLGSGGGI